MKLLRCVGGALFFPVATVIAVVIDLKIGATAKTFLGILLFPIAVVMAVILAVVLLLCAVWPERIYEFDRRPKASPDRAIRRV